MRKSVKMIAIFIVAATISFACTSCTPLSENKFYFEEDGWMALKIEDGYARIIGYQRIYEDMTELVLPVKLKGLEILAIDGSLGRTYDLPKKLFVPKTSARKIFVRQLQIR